MQVNETRRSDQTVLHKHLSLAAEHLKEIRRARKIQRLAIVEFFEPARDSILELSEVFQMRLLDKTNNTDSRI